jgi:hypothetical protein
MFTVRAVDDFPAGYASAVSVLAAALSDKMNRPANHRL